MIIIPHSSNIKSLVLFQNRLIEKFNYQCFTVYKNQPLWIALSDDKGLSPAEYAKSIKKVQIQPPSIINNKLISNVNIELQDKTINSSLLLCTFINDVKGQDGYGEDVFPMELKIFRVAKDVCCGEFGVAVEDEKWVRI